MHETTTRAASTDASTTTMSHVESMVSGRPLPESAPTVLSRVGADGGGELAVVGETDALGGDAEGDAGDGDAKGDGGGDAGEGGGDGAGEGGGNGFGGGAGGSMV